MEPTFPIEFLVRGTPVSLQASRARSKLRWKEAVRDASRPSLPDDHFASEARIAVTLFYFPAVPMGGDIDNIVKLILDALTRHIYLDDRQVERIVVQKFDPDETLPFTSPSDVLGRALDGPRPILYIKISDDPYEDLR